ncbi:tetratricopeptide repeat protein [Saccharothrix syringae]|uniref:Tetratricopeptide repeat protein n=1 Tax=Saccharothrix syringae TaxID=103733 RepID=A0A5Q0HEK2_SACSY|nr:tetratricopeptide repeat protein [Saccharothrix syringae]
MVGVLGTLEARQGDRELPVGHARRRSVLAALAVDAGRLLPADVLVDRVWGERPPVRARSTLRTYLTHLRRTLAPTGLAILRRDGGYLLDTGPDTVDLHRFHRLLASARRQPDPHTALGQVEDALELWRGEPLAELDTPWAQAVRERLRRDRDAAEADRADWALACGRHHELLPELVARAEAEPLDERVAGRLVLALYRSGRQADALSHYHRVRRHLADELGTDPGPALQELHQRILTADPALSPADTEAPAVPRQLPSVPRSFIGRTDQLAALDDRGTTVISAIGGAGGIGKTWLALTWAHRNIDRFPDGQLFVDLRGFSPDGPPMDPAVAVRGFLDALGVTPAHLPVDPHAQAARYRSLVADRRMLIVLDNAATADQVVPLLPGTASCTVLVTSRHRLPTLVARHGARALSLDVLTAAESRALLGADRVTADERAADELIALCGGFPLALGILTARTGRELAELAAELRETGLDALDDDDPTASLPAVLSWSLRHLTDEQRTAFALLGIAPGPDHGLAAAASLIGASVPQTRKVLRALEDASLVERRPNGRHGMHDLVRAYAITAARELPEPTRQAALHRVFDFYLHTAHNAYRALAPTRDPVPLTPPTTGSAPLYPASTRAEAMRWFDAEHPTLLAVQRHALDQREHDHAWKLAVVLGKYLLRRGLLDDHLTTWEVGHAAAPHSDDPTGEVTTLRGLGLAHSHTGGYADALVHLRSSLLVAPDEVQRTHTHYALAEAALRHHDVANGLVHARHAVRGYRHVGQPVRLAAALALLGELRGVAGDHRAAESRCTRALSVQRQHGDHTGQASTLSVLGTTAGSTGRHEAALDRYTEALALFRETDNTHQAADTLERLGHTHSALDQPHRARTAWRAALELYREQGRDTDADRVQRRLDDLGGTRPARTTGLAE